MNKILAYRDLIGKEMDEESANRAVHDMMRKSNNYVPTAAMIISEVSRYFGLEESVVKGPSRNREAVNARQAAMYLVRRMTNLSTPDIGREFGGRDHTTVIHARDKISEEIKTNPRIKITVADIKNMILNRFNYPVFIVSSYLNEGIEEIKSIWKVNETAVFIGSSGVGKSTLINHLIGEDKIKTKSIRCKDDRGRHTTTSRNLYILKDNRVVIDEPGIRSVALNDDYDLNQIFSKISELETECKYTTCTHENSNGCAVIEAINNGIITLEELNRYKKLKLKDNRDNKRKIQKDKINYYKQTKRNHLK